MRNLSSDADIVKATLNTRAEEVCKLLLPGGKQVGREWHAGDVRGGPGDSLKVCLDGKKIGLWKDFAGSPKDAGDLLALWQQCRGVEFKTALHDAAKWAGVPLNGKCTGGNGIVQGAPVPAKPAEAKAARDTGEGWARCVEALGDAEIESLAKWRSYSVEFVRWLKTQELIGLHEGMTAFPVHEFGKVIGWHYRIKADGTWRVDGGCKMQPLVIGDPTSGLAAVFESQWDGFALMDKLGWPEKQEPLAIIVTRGASNGKLVRGLIESGSKVMAFVQNDTPAEKWLEDVSAHAGNSTVKRVVIPLPHKDLNDWTRAGASEANIRKAIRDAVVFRETQGAGLERCIVTGGELAKMQVEPREFILRPFFKAGDLGIIFAKRGECKTWLSMLCSEAIASGGCAGPWKAEKPASVLYVDGEMPLEETRRRSGLLAGAAGTPSSRVNFLHHEVYFEGTGKTLNLADPDTQATITTLLVALACKVLVLDNLGCLFYGLKENEADSWEKVLPWLLQLRRLKIAVILVAHAGRNGEVRGTSRREDQAFWCLKLERRGEDASGEGTAFVTMFTKNRNALDEDCPSLSWSLVEREGVMTVSAKPITGVQLLVSWVEAGLSSASDIAAEMRVSKGQVSKLAKKAVEMGLITNNGGYYGARKAA